MDWLKLVEINGYGLLLEWKNNNEQIPTDQKIVYQKLTIDGKLTVIVINGNAETMEIKKYCTFYKGKKSDWIEADLTILKQKIKSWILLDTCSNK